MVTFIPFWFAPTTVEEKDLSHTSRAQGRRDGYLGKWQGHGDKYCLGYSEGRIQRVKDDKRRKNVINRSKTN